MSLIMARVLSSRYIVIRPELSQPIVVPTAAKPSRSVSYRIERRGLGDLVEVFLKPAAVWIDSLTLGRPGRVVLALGRRIVHRPQRPADPALAFMVGLAVRAGLVTVPLSGCSACSRRRRWLNRLVPDWRSVRAWLAAPRRLWRAITGHSLTV